MHAEKLNDIIVKETEALKDLLKLLEEQYDMLIKNDIFGLEGIVEDIQFANKNIAEIEVERRKEAAGTSMNNVVQSSNDDELDRNFRNAKKLLLDIQVQKDTNDMLIKQGLGFSTRILNILNPNRNIKTYNAYGKISK